jgi:hypothetical protein
MPQAHPPGGKPVAPHVQKALAATAQLRAAPAPLSPASHVQAAVDAVRRRAPTPIPVRPAVQRSLAPVIQGGRPGQSGAPAVRPIPVQSPSAPGRDVARQPAATFARVGCVQASFEDYNPDLPRLTMPSMTTVVPTSFRNRVLRNSNELLEQFSVGGRDLLTFFGSKGATERTQLLDRYYRMIKQAEFAAKDPGSTLKNLRTVITREVERQQLDTSPENIQRLVAGWYKDHIAGMFVQLVASAMTIGLLANWPVRRIMGAKVEPHLSALDPSTKKIARPLARFAIKRTIAPMIGLPVFGLQLLGAAGTLIDDGKEIAKKYPDLHADLIEFRLDMWAGTLKTVLEEIERQKESKTRKMIEMGGETKS